MFTPPPSPTPPRTHHGRHAPAAPPPSPPHHGPSLTVTRPGTPASCTSSTTSSSCLPTPAPSCQSTPEKPCAPLDDAQLRALMQKRRHARRLRLSILLVPLLLVLITLSTRCTSHPAVLDALSADAPAHGWPALDWQSPVHDPHARRAATASGAAFPSQTTASGGSATSVMTASEAASSTAPPVASTSGGSSALPTVPAAPPALPTPFPQPFDSTGITTNFSTEGCRNFFLNMTQTAPFRQCRPFSMLVQYSSAFIGAQFNLSELNDIIWGTCNTDPSAEECAANMAWFADALQDACATDLKANNEVATGSLLGLQTYSLLRDAACLASPSTSAYCYVSAFGAGAHAADAYYFTLPLGTALPAASDPSCSACTQRVMAAFVARGLNASGLRATYAAAAQITNDVCGAGFVQEMVVQDSKAPRARGPALVAALGAVAVAVAGAGW